MRLCAPPRWGLWACAAAGVLLQAARACIVIDLNPSGGTPLDAGPADAIPAAPKKVPCSLPSTRREPAKRTCLRLPTEEHPAKAKQSSGHTCLPAGFHANVNNLLALIPLVAHLHNDTVHYRMEYFHYKVRLEARHVLTVLTPAQRLEQCRMSRERSVIT